MIMKYKSTQNNRLIMQLKITDMLRTLFIFSFVFCISLSSSAQDYKKTQDGIIVELDKSKSDGAAKLQLKILSDDIVQVLAYPENNSKEPISLCVENKEWPHVVFEAKSLKDKIIVTTAKIQIEIAMPEGTITYLDKAGNLLLKEDGRSFKALSLPNDAGVSMKQHLSFQKDEAIYGWGQYMDGVMNFRGQVAELMQENTATAVPVFVSTKGYGMLWDNYSFTKFVDKQQTFISSELGDAINYYFFYGPTMDEAIAGYREVTGAAPMFPKWAYGYIQSRENYLTENDLMSAAKEFRKREIPIDCIIKDWAYWENGEWGQKTIRKDLFPDPTAMVKKLHDEMNLHTIISIWPSKDGGADYEEFKNAGEDYYFSMESPELEDNGYLIYNAWNEAARKLYWEQLQKGILVHGFNGLWCDNTEPEGGFLDNDSDKNKSRLSSSFGSGTRYLNSYPLMHAKGIYENWRETGPETRLINLTRSGYAGQQKYGVVVWSGDIGATWDVFKTQIAGGLNFAMSGIPYWGNDIGAFFVKKEENGYLGHGDYDAGPADDGYKELYVRWIQYGTFCPQMRSHGTDFPREPWRFGEEGDWAYDAILDMIKLRYRLMPYIYTVANKVTTEHYTMMRGMAMDHQNDPMTYDIDDQFMFGPSLMVSPVVEKGVNNRKIYLPEGAGWYNFWGGNYLSGGQTIVEQTPIETIPLYIKAGSILTLGPDVQYATEKTDPIEIRIYEGADGEFVLYEDENDTYNYENGKFSKIKFTWDDANQKLTIGAREGQFLGMPETHTFNIVLYKKKVVYHSFSPFEIEAGLNLVKEPNKVINYNGEKVEVTL